MSARRLRGRPTRRRGGAARRRGAGARPRGRPRRRARGLDGRQRLRPPSPRHRPHERGPAACCSQRDSSRWPSGSTGCWDRGASRPGPLGWWSPATVGVGLTIVLASRHDPRSRHRALQWDLRAWGVVACGVALLVSLVVTADRRRPARSTPSTRGTGHQLPLTMIPGLLAAMGPAWFAPTPREIDGQVDRRAPPRTAVRFDHVTITYPEAPRPDAHRLRRRVRGRRARAGGRPHGSPASRRCCEP